MQSLRVLIVSLALTSVAIAQETPSTPPDSPTPAPPDTASPPVEEVPVEEAPVEGVEGEEEEEPVVILPPAEDTGPRELTGIKGSVTADVTKEALIEAEVKVVKGGTQVVRTDVDGNFELALPPGTYDLRVFYPLYVGRRISGVVVEAGKATPLLVILSQDAQFVQELVVEAKADPRTEAARLTVRRKAAVVQDAVSAQEISRTPDGNAGEAVKRVVSATVVGGRYVFVRGLGGRYSLTLLNGVQLPSPDPDSTAVPLDLFPSGLLANLTVVKSYAPNLPGTFSGGALLIETNTYPSELEVRLKLSSAFDSEATGQDMATYRGGDYDYLGFDDGTRAMPSTVPANAPVRRSDDPDEGLDEPALAAIGRDFENIWEIRERQALPAWGFSAQMGDTLRFSGKRLGYLASAQYGIKQDVEHSETRKIREELGEFVVTDDFRNDTGIEAVTWGGLANMGLELDKKNLVTLFSLYTRSSDDRANLSEGFSETDGANNIARRLQFVVRQMSFTQLGGVHRFGDIELRWQGNVSVTTRDEPDTRDLEYDQRADTGVYAWDQGSESRLFADLFDVSAGGGADLAVPIPHVTLRAGVLFQDTEREFSARRFQFDTMMNDFARQSAGPETLFAPDNMGVYLLPRERTQQTDAYDATVRVLGLYAFGETTSLGRFRAIGGLRVENATQRIEAGSPYALGEPRPEDRADRTDTNLMPSVNLVYALTELMNLRAGYSYTLARPQLRELAPYAYYDFVRRRQISGNPALLDTRIHNLDLRWERFHASGVLAASAFYKVFSDPIEATIQNPQQGDLFYQNVDGAQAAGLELEARSAFPYGFRAAANVTLVWSTVELGEAGVMQTNQERALQGQSPYVVNLDVGWASKRSGTEVSLLYNVFGARIGEVGISPLPDVVEQPFHRVDLTVSQRLPQDLRLKLAGANLLDQDVEFEQGGFVVQRYKPGVVVSATLEWIMQ